MSGQASRVSRVLMTGPLAPFAEAYTAELRGRGYTPLTTVNELRQVGRLSRWLESRGLSAGELSVERVELFLIWQRAGGRHRAEWSRPGLLCLLEVLDGLRVLAGEKPAPASSPIDLLLASFERYLLTERGLTADTCQWLRGACAVVPGWAAVRGGACGAVGGRGDRWGAAAQGRLGGVGQRDPVLRLGAARVSAVLLRRGACGD